LVQSLQYIYQSKVHPVKNNFTKIFFVFLLISFWSACQAPEKELLNEIQNSELTPDQISYQTEVQFIDSSHIKAVLFAPRASIFQRKMETILDGGINVQFLSKYTGERLSLLTADSAIIDDNTRNMLAKGSVFVYSDSSRVELRTEVLNWINSTQKLYSTEYVEIKTDREIIRGYGFESDINLDNYVIHKVSGIQNIK